MEKIDFPARINKYIAWRGIATRRGADELIKKGLVKINGVVAELGVRVNRDDVVEVDDGQAQKNLEYFLYYKPKDVATNELENEQIRKILTSGFFLAGQLEKESEGLVVITNDGRLTEPLLHGRYEREYLVETDRDFHETLARKIEQGIRIEGEMTLPCEAKVLSERLISLVLKEEKRHQVKRMFSAIGYDNVRVKRVRIANLGSRGMVPENTKPINGLNREQFLVLMGLNKDKRLK